MEKTKLIKVIEVRKERSAWSKGVKDYALEMVEDFDNNQLDDLNLIAPCDLNYYVKKLCLNGASDFKELSYGGNYLIYDEDIAKRLSTKSELKSVTHKDGSLREKGNKRETWLDVQARALYQAYLLIYLTLKTERVGK